MPIRNRGCPSYTSLWTSKHKDVHDGQSRMATSLSDDQASCKRYTASAPAARRRPMWLVAKCRRLGGGGSRVGV